MLAACFPWTIFLSCRSVILACLFSSLLSCFVRHHNLLLSVSMLRLAVFFIQLLLLASFLVLMNLALACFNDVLFSNRWCDIIKVSCYYQFIVCVVQVFIPVWFVVFSRTFWDTFLCCLKNITVKLFYNNIHISFIYHYYLCSFSVQVLSFSSLNLLHSIALPSVSSEMIYWCTQ